MSAMMERSALADSVNESERIKYWTEGDVGDDGDDGKVYGKGG